MTFINMAARRRRRRFGSGGGITGTAPVLASLVNGESLSTKVTWGSYSGTGTITTTKQMKLNAGSWVAYVGGTVVNTGEMWTVRELVSDDNNTDQEFSSGFQIVIATALVPSQFGIGDWVVNPTMTTGSATFTIYRLPADNGSAITALQYRIGAGSWVSFSGTTTGNYAVTGLTDGVQNSMTIRAVNAIGSGTASAAKFVTSQTSAALVTGNSATIVAGGVTWTLSSARDYGVTDTGIVTVDWTSGLTVLSRSPAGTTDAGRVVNGTMKNPVRGNLGDNLVQGLHESAGGWSAGANQSFPISTADGDIVLGAIHEPGAYANTRDGVNTSYSALYFKSGGLPVNAVAPAIFGWAGRGTPTAYAINITDVAASLPSYSLAGVSYPSVASILAKIDRLEVGPGATEETAGAGYEAMLTYQFGDNGNNYGQDTGAMIGGAGLHLVGDVATTGEKQTLLKALIRHGVQWHDPVIGVGVSPGADGGHWQFQLIPIAMALHYLGRGTAMDNLPSTWQGNFFGQPFIHTSTSVANLLPHSDNAKPQASRRRTVSAVSGTTVTISTFRGTNTGDSASLSFVGMDLVRESDGATGRVTSMPNENITSGTSTTDVVISAQPTPAFAISDVVYTRLPETVYDGDADWRIENRVHVENPAPGMVYRPQSKWSDDVLALRAQGIWRDAWEATELWTVRQNRANDPSGGTDYTNGHDTVGGQPMASTFWNAHAATVLGSYPVVVTSTVISGTGVDGTDLTATPAVVAPSTGLIRSYQWYNNGVAIGGATSSTYPVVTGDVGDSLTVWETITNAKGTQISRSAPVVAIAGYTPNAVNFDGSTWTYSSSITAVSAATQGALVMTFRKNSTWQNNVSFFSASSAGGTLRVEAYQITGGRIDITLKNSSGTQVGRFLTPTSEFAVDTYYTYALSWDTVTQTWVARKRPDGGSWATVTGSVASLTASETVGPLGRFGITAHNTGGDFRSTNLDLHDFWLDFGQKPDFTDSAVLAKFLPTVSKGATGSLPTGTAPQFFFSGATVSWHTNKGLNGGTTESGVILDASAQPT